MTEVCTHCISKIKNDLPIKPTRECFIYTVLIVEKILHIDTENNFYLIIFLGTSVLMFR